MPLEIEGNRDIARSRQRQGIGFHKLSRAGEAVGNDDRGSFRASCALVDGRWRSADLELYDRKAGTFAFELPSSGADAQNAESGGYPGGIVAPIVPFPDHLRSPGRDKPDRKAQCSMAAVTRCYDRKIRFITFGWVRRRIFAI